VDSTPVESVPTLTPSPVEKMSDIRITRDRRSFVAPAPRHTSLIVNGEWNLLNSRQDLRLTTVARSIMASDSRGFLGSGNFSRVESREPSTNRFTKFLNFKPAMDFRKTIQFE
jgi:hypothetical protein